MMRNGNANTTTTTVQVAGGVDRSGAVLVLGLGLIVVNFVGTPVMGELTGKPITTTFPWGTSLLALLAVFLLLLLAKTGEAGSNFAVIFLVALWVVWLLNNSTSLAKILGQPAPSNTSGAK